MASVSFRNLARIPLSRRWASENDTCSVASVASLTTLASLASLASAVSDVSAA